MEFGGDSQEESDAKANDLIKGLRQGRALPPPQYRDPFPNDSSLAKDVWAIRENVLAATAFVPGQRDRHEDGKTPPFPLIV